MTETQFMPNATEQERIQALQETAHKTYESGYKRPLSREEIELRKSDYFKNDSQIKDLQSDIKDLVAPLKENIKKLERVNSILRAEIKEKSVSEDGILYDVANLDTMFMETYNKAGNMVDIRLMTPAEKSATKNIWLGIAKTA